MLLTKRGCLLLFSECGNQYCYHLTNIDAGEEQDIFTPHLPQNMDLTDELQSISPCTQIQYGDLTNEGLPQIYSCTGKGPRSSLRVLRHGLSITELAVQKMPGTPYGIWSVKKKIEDEFDSYIIVSFIDATLVLEISDSVSEVKDSKFMQKAKTLSVQLMDNNDILQIHTNGVRSIEGLSKIKEWKPPDRKSIKCGTANSRQAVVGIDGGSLIYFEINSSNILDESAIINVGSEISCVALCPIPEGRQRAPFLAVGTWNEAVTIYSIQPSESGTDLTNASVQATTERIYSVCMNFMNITEGIPSLFLNIGLANGVYQRIEIDPLTGKSSDARIRELGTQPVTVLPLTVDDQSAVIALSSKPWLSYIVSHNYRLTPISYDHLDYCHNFHSQHCPDGIVAINNESLRIFSINRIDDDFNQTILPLTFTPRRLLVHPQTNNLIVIESEPNSFSYKQVSESLGEQGMQLLDEDTYGKGNTVKSLLGVPRPQPSKVGECDHWGSCIQLIDPNTLGILDTFPFQQDEAALSSALVEFHDRNGEIILVVGTAIKYQLFPKKIESGRLYVFRILSNTKFQLLHTTEVESLPSAMCQFHGRLLVGIDKTLRIYDLGKRKLLRKCENRVFLFYYLVIPSFYIYNSYYG